MSSTLSAQEATESPSPDRLVCGICKRQLSRYTCPTCNIPYCSTTCFRNPLHEQCTEQFYKRELELDVKGDKKQSIEERKRMMEILKKFEEESLEYDQVLAADSDDEEEDSLAKRLEGIDLDRISSSQLWDSLSASERASFLQQIKDPSTSNVLMHLATKDRVEPWWIPSAEEDDSRRVADRPTMMELRLPPSIRLTTPTPSLVYNIVSICLSYCYATRLTKSPLCSIQKSTHPDDYDEAVFALKNLSPFLFDKTSKHRYTSLEEVALDCGARIERMSHSYFRLLLDDTICLLRPVLVTETDSPNSTQHRNLMLVISDLHDFLNGQNPAKPTHTQLKLQFYAAYIHSEAFSADAVRYMVGELEVERKKYDGEQVTESVALR